MAKKIISFKEVIFFWLFLVAAIVFVFTYQLFNITRMSWHLTAHIAIIFFCLGIMLLSLKLNEKATRFIFWGAALGIFIESIFFLSHIFEEYNYLSGHSLFGIVWVIGFFLMLSGFKEAAK